jgi:hypothetical protein
VFFRRIADAIPTPRKMRRQKMKLTTTTVTDTPLPPYRVLPDARWRERSIELFEREF